MIQFRACLPASIQQQHALWSPLLIRRQAFLLGVCVTGDWLSNSAVKWALAAPDETQRNRRVFAVLLDNATHASIAAAVWGVVIAHETPRPLDRVILRLIFSSRQRLEVIVAFVLGSVVDLDHFLGARAFSMTKALNLQHRPPAHNTTFILALAFLTYLLLDCLPTLFNSLADAHTMHHTPASCRGWGTRYALFILSAGLSHQLRDAVKHGLWIWPFGSTAKLPPVIQLAATMMLPMLVRVCLQMWAPLTVEGLVWGGWMRQTGESSPAEMYERIPEEESGEEDIELGVLR